MPTRLPPPTGPPPRYAAVVSRVYPYSLRPVVFFTSFIGLIYGLALGVESIRDRSANNESSKEKLFDIIFAILFFVLAGLEAFAIVVAIVQKLSLARLLVVIAPLGILVNLGVQVLSVIVHFTLKSDLIKQCVADELNYSSYDDFDDSSIDTSDATSICNSSWSRSTWGVFAFLVFTVLVSMLFGSILMSYYRQLLDPSSVRQRVPPSQQNQAFQMQPGYNYPPPPPPNGQQPWMVPPYPGPPADAPPPPPHGYEKSDYQPEANWAQHEYAPPSGAPPARHEFGTNRAEDEAWERARSEGVTAHFTGQGSAPRFGDAERGEGYVIPNAEEDEAWERARNEGVTAHLTGQGRGRGDAI